MSDAIATLRLCPADSAEIGTDHKRDAKPTLAKASAASPL